MVRSPGNLSSSYNYSSACTVCNNHVRFQCEAEERTEIFILAKYTCNIMVLFKIQ